MNGRMVDAIKKKDKKTKWRKDKKKKKKVRKPQLKMHNHTQKIHAKSNTKIWVVAGVH